MLAALGRSELTVKEYSYDIICFARFYMQDHGLVPADTPFEEIDVSHVGIDMLNKVTTDDLLAFIIWLSRNRKQSNAARARHVASLRSFFKYLYNKKHLIDQNPAYDLESPKIGKRLPKYLTLDQSRELLETEGYPVDDYPNTNVETVDDVCWITFTEKDRTLRCDLSVDGNALYLYNSEYDQRRGSTVDHPFVKPDELMQATQKMKNFLRKNHPALLDRVDRLAMERLIIQGNNRYLDFSDGEWQGLNFVIRTSPTLRIEYFHAPV